MASAVKEGLLVGRHKSLRRGGGGGGGTTTSADLRAPLHRQADRRAGGQTDSVSPYGSKLLQSIYQVCFHHSLTETPDVHHRAGRDPVRVSVIVLQHRNCSYPLLPPSHHTGLTPVGVGIRSFPIQHTSRVFLSNETIDETNSFWLPR